MQRRRAAGWLGQATSRVSRPTPRASPRRDGVGQGAERRRPARALADRRLGRPCAVDQDRLTFDGAGDFEAGRLRRPQLALRRPRARHGRDRQRHGAVQAAALRRDLPDLQRLHAAADAAGGADGAAGRSSSSRHDSIGVGEDGPTHQPIEQLAALRAIPGLITMRPGDANEVAEAWRVVLRSDRRARPASSCRARRCRRWTAADMPRPTGVARGAYMLADSRRRPARADPDGHRQRGVALRRRPTRSSTAEGVRARVVSMPSWDLFEAQDEAYRARGAAARGHRRASRSSRPRPWAGTAMSASPARSSRMRSFGASAPMQGRCRPSSASRRARPDAARRQTRPGKSRSGKDAS